jgi:hypothetical protein
MRSQPVEPNADVMAELLESTQQYEIRVRGVLGRTLRGAFPGLRARADRGDTILTGRLPDQAALHGVLAQIESLNLELIEVRRRQLHDHGETAPR